MTNQVKDLLHCISQWKQRIPKRVVFQGIYLKEIINCFVVNVTINIFLESASLYFDKFAFKMFGTNNLYYKIKYVPPSNITETMFVLVICRSEFVNNSKRCVGLFIIILVTCIQLRTHQSHPHELTQHHSLADLYIIHGTAFIVRYLYPVNQPPLSYIIFISSFYVESKRRRHSVKARKTCVHLRKSTL